MPTGLWLYAFLALWLLIIAESFVLSAVIRQVSQLHSHWSGNEIGSGLPLGVLAPALSGTDLYKRPLAARYGDRKTIIYFLSAGCSPCRAVLDHAPMLNTPEAQTVLVVAADEFKAKTFLLPLPVESNLQGIPVLIDPKREMLRRFEARATPYVMVVDQDGRIGAIGFETTPDAIRSMLERSEQRRKERAGEAALLTPRPDQERDADHAVAAVR
ncbi:MAG TPA: redoxin family protein [Chthonomonadales bacterium]|nr:redoxin family protein [Chthonomonadales bacterium]